MPNRRRLFPAFGLLILAVRPALAQCILPPGAPPDFVRSEGETRLLARVLQSLPLDTVPLPRLGQLLAVEEANGPGDRSLGADSLAIIVRWIGIEGPCSWTPVRDTLATGTRHLFTATLRADSQWINRRPTFDVRSGLLADVSESPAGGARLSDYRSLLATMPGRKEWETDCRPGVGRVERWMDSHPELSKVLPFSAVRTGLRPACNNSVQLHAATLERWESSTPIPAALRAVFRRERCRDDSAVFAAPEKTVDGRFTMSDAPQWVYICVGPSTWRLIVVVLESPPRIIELMRIAGHDWGWIAGSAPAEYFEWTSSRDIGSGRWDVPPPRRGAVLLKFISAGDDQNLAFYETPSGWVHVAVRCCRWPE